MLLGHLTAQYGNKGLKRKEIQIVTYLWGEKIPAV